MLPPEILLIAGSVLWGLAWLTLAWILLQFLTVMPKPAEKLDGFESARRQRLRDGSIIYRLFEAGVRKLAKYATGKNPAKLEKLRRALLIAADPLPVTPEEYVAMRQIESLLAGIVGFVFGLMLFSSLVIGVVFAGIAAFIYQLLMSNKAGSRAQKRMRDLKKRLPFAIDLMALMMEAGASFQESLQTAIRENPGHPIADEFNLVMREIKLGRTRHDALLALQNRLNDDDMNEIVFAVNKGEELGTPLSQILRTQAEQMRLKRSQWAEKAAGEAQVNIVFPGMIIMLACLLIVTAPFILGALFPV